MKKIILILLLICIKQSIITLCQENIGHNINDYSTHISQMQSTNPYQRITQQNLLFLDHEEPKMVINASEISKNSKLIESLSQDQGFLDENNHLENEINNLDDNENELNFFIFGDYGYFENDTEVLTSAQKLADYVVQKVNTKFTKYDFVVSVGDNIYDNGIQSNPDPRVLTLVNKTFKGSELGLDWYTVLGNHDCHGNMDATMKVNSYLPYWKQAEPYYLKIFSIGKSDKKAAFMFLNGCELACKNKYSTECFEPMWKNIDFDNIEHQLQWFNNSLETLSNDPSIAWKIVVVHWAIFSAGGNHGDNDALKEQLLPMLLKYKIDVVLSGHDHSVQYLRTDIKELENKINKEKLNTNDSSNNLINDTISFSEYDNLQLLEDINNLFYAESIIDQNNFLNNNNNNNTIKDIDQQSDLKQSGLLLKDLLINEKLEPLKFDLEIFDIIENNTINSNPNIQEIEHIESQNELFKTLKEDMNSNIKKVLFEMTNNTLLDDYTNLQLIDNQTLIDLNTIKSISNNPPNLRKAINTESSIPSNSSISKTIDIVSNNNIPCTTSDSNSSNLNNPKLRQLSSLPLLAEKKNGTSMAINLEDDCDEIIDYNSCQFDEFFAHELTKCGVVKNSDYLRTVYDNNYLESKKIIDSSQFFRESTVLQHDYLHQFVIGNGGLELEPVCVLKHQRSLGKLRYSNSVVGIGEGRITNDKLEINLFSVEGELLYKLSITKQLIESN